jgi:hypothetical protein|tara:strand:- start:381 stop:497 length:117 start_codon:yes stop_codon:yes gene_type:complete
VTGDPGMIRTIKFGVAVVVLLCLVKGTLDFCRATGIYG